MPLAHSPHSRRGFCLFVCFKKASWGPESCLVVKNTDLFARGPGFDSQHPYNVTPNSRRPKSFLASVSTRHTSGAQTCMQARHPYVGCRDGSAVRALLLQRTQAQSLAPTGWPSISSNSSSQGCVALSWHLWGTGTHVVLTKGKHSYIK